LPASRNPRALKSATSTWTKAIEAIAATTFPIASASGSWPDLPRHHHDPPRDAPPRRRRLQLPPPRPLVRGPLVPCSTRSAQPPPHPNTPENSSPQVLHGRHVKPTSGEMSGPASFRH
jgi:hypothetical protein